MDSSSGDLETKYHKIAAEYSKLRAQASVLKKAVVEEQSRNIALHDALREREQNVRKSSQEIDSLTFRNQQLTKRVTVLQNELDATEIRSKRGKSKMPDSHNCVDCTLTMNVLDEELQKKILENAELLSKIHDEDAAHKQELAVLHAHADKLKHELEQYSVVKSASENKLKAIIDKLELDKATFSGQNSTFLSDNQFHSMGRGMESHVQPGSAISLNPLSFIGTNEDFNKSKGIWFKPKLAIMISKTGDCVFKLIAASTDYHTLTQERLSYLQSPLSAVNHMFSSHLKENVSLLQRIQVDYSELQRAILESRDDLFHSRIQVLSEQLTAYTQYLMKLLPYQLLSLEEENVALPNNEHVVSLNMEVAFQVNCVTNCFVRLSNYVKLLSSQSEQLRSEHSQYRYLPALFDVLTVITDSVKDLSQAFAAKRCKEQEIPTISDKVKAINDSIVHSLSSMAVASEKICNILTDSHLKMSKPTRTMDATSRAHNGCGSELLATPSREVTADHEEVPGPIDGDTLSEQLAKSRKTAVLLEQEKEHWHLEYKLLQLKHSKRIEELENKLMLSQSSNATENKDADQLQTKDQLLGPCTITNLLGHLDAPLVLNAEMEAREQEVKNYLTCRIDHLVATCQGADTKAIAFRAECAVLRKRLDLSMLSKMQCECRLNDCLKQVVKLQEELHTTTHNYETQLSIMSEHLANMNDKLTVQRDEIDQLKYQLTNKPSHKRKQK